MKLYKIVTILFLFINSVLLGQNMNQLDQNGKQHGVWKKNFENTTILRFEGEFYHGKEIGLFKFYQNINNKAILTATREFLNQGTRAEVKFYASNGKLISEGFMDGKIYIGEWKYYQKNSDKLLTLEYFDAGGNLTGERFIYYVTGQVSQKENYKNGKLDGLSVWYSEANVIIKEYTYVKGLLHGIAKFYDPKGELMSEGYYKNDQKDGIWKYYEGGTLKEEKNLTPK